MIDQNDVLRLRTLVQEMNAILDKYQQPEVPPPGPVEPPAKAITPIWVDNLSDKPQSNVAFTIGHPFVEGHLQPDTGLAGRLDNGDVIPLQIDVKARHNDGSVRHAIISGVMPTLFTKESRKLDLIQATAVTTKREPPVPEIPMNSGITITLDGNRYRVLPQNIRNPKPWLQGEIVTEFQAMAPFTGDDGKDHPHLSARLGLRWYPSAQKARISIVVENATSYEPNPQNYAYAVEINIAGKVVYSEQNQIHYHHARWRKTFWHGDEPQVNVRADVAYLLSTTAVAHYDLKAKPTDEVLQWLANEWTPDKTKPMAIGLAYRSMADTGGRRDIGLMPGWSVMRLLSQDPRAVTVDNGTADMAGSWPTHYRDKDTDQPISIIDYPYMTLPGRSPSDSYNRPIKRQEAFPALVSNSISTGLTPESSHQPQFAYGAYLQTGDYEYLEEMQFWAMWNIIAINPSSIYRENIKGLVRNHQVRAQAWSLRSLIDCAYITPDDDRLKKHFHQLVDSNLDWYNANYTDNPNANKLGVLENTDAFPYKNRTAMAPWQHAFFVQVVGLAAERGFEKAKKLFGWASQFQKGTLMGEGVDRRAVANYSYVVRPSASAPIFSNFKEAFNATVESMKTGSGEEKETLRVLGTQQNTVSGYPNSPTGYPSNIQPAMAMIGGEAWELFDSREIKPDYTQAPQFAIIPRSM